MKRLCSVPGCLDFASDGSKYCARHKEHEQIDKQLSEKKEQYDIQRLRSIQDIEKYRKNVSLRNTKEWKRLRKKILEEHKHCQKCGSQNNLEVHHIIQPAGNPGLFFEQTNLIVLCSKCHYKLTKKQRKK